MHAILIEKKENLNITEIVKIVRKYANISIKSIKDNICQNYPILTYDDLDESQLNNEMEICKEFKSKSIDFIIKDLDSNEILNTKLLQNQLNLYKEISNNSENNF